MVLTDAFPCMILHRRNLSCIGCGCPRPVHSPSTVAQPLMPNGPPTRHPSPRFATTDSEFGFGEPAMHHSQASTSYPFARHLAPAVAVQPKVSTPALHHILTPSGREFSVGGKVQNVSTDPLAPCVMYWPDNEPLPEQGQLRPSGLLGIPVCSSHGPQVVFDIFDMASSTPRSSIPATADPSNTSLAIGFAGSATT